MWKHKVTNSDKTSDKTDKKSGTKTNQNLQHLSPFASHSSESISTSTTASTPSPRPLCQLPSGVRYIRQTPNSVYRSIPFRATAGATHRKLSPTKNIRFADPLISAKKSDKGNTKTTTKCKQIATEKSRTGRPVINAKPVDERKTSPKTVAVSPASQTISPIFSTTDFGNKSKDKPINVGLSGKRNKLSGDSTPNSPVMQTQTQSHIEIKTPNGTVKRSTANGHNVHRNTLSVPIQESLQTDDKKFLQKSLSVNVNVAVGLDCKNNDVIDGHNREVDQMCSCVDPMMDDLKIDNLDEMVDYSEGISFALKVAVRLRPFLESEIDSKNDISVIDMKENTVRVINSDNENYNRMEFGFDVCLNSSDKDLFDYADQDIVYRKMGQPLLERALEGYNVCLFAYGQTGSGKSFTMMGTDTNPGIIPRFVHELYKRFSTFEDIIFNVEVSYCEIYNEKLYDLLSDDRNVNKKILRIREHPQTGPYVEHLSLHEATDCEEVMNLLMSGNRRRATSSTAANADSSRSHSIFTIILTQFRSNEDLDMNCTCSSRINLIDLAGSERVGCSGTSGERLKEGNHINKSLLNLGKVISRLADREIGSNNKFAYIPYRDSALTWLLKESLGGNSRTSMIATISSAKCHLEETLSTLRYAATARRIVNFVHINEDPKSRKIRELLEEIAFLRQQNNNSYEIVINDENVTKRGKATEVKANKSQMCTKSTETSFTEPKKVTVSQSTSTSFLKKIVTDSKATETSFSLKSVETCNTGTVTKSVETCNTGTVTVERPTPLDLMRTKLLEEQQRMLLKQIREQKRILLGKLPESSEHLNEDLPDKSEHWQQNTVEEVITKSENVKSYEIVNKKSSKTASVSTKEVQNSGDCDWGQNTAETVSTQPNNENNGDWGESNAETVPNQQNDQNYDEWGCDENTTKTAANQQNNENTGDCDWGQNTEETVPNQQQNDNNGDYDWGGNTTETEPKQQSNQNDDEWGYDQNSTETVTNQQNNENTGDCDWGQNTDETVPNQQNNDNSGDCDWGDTADTAQTVPKQQNNQNADEWGENWD